MTPQESIAHYRIVSKLGEGGMGAVYRATDTKLNRDVAIKVLPDAFAADPDRLARFAREAQVLAALNHPNIAAIYGVEDRALVMELVEGEDLKCPVPIETAIAYAKQIAEALEAAHDKGIVHRDLKPSNIKVTSQGTVKVLDFGLAAMTQGSAVVSGNPQISPTLTMMGATQAGLILGTASYMSPEQAAGKPVDKRADIWSFGVVLWEMLTGKLLFEGETVSHTLASMLQGPINFDSLPKETPASVKTLLKRCLDRNVRNRLRDIGEARVALENAGQAPEAPTPRSRRTLSWIAATTIALMAAGVFGFLYFRASKPVQLPVVRFPLAVAGGQAFGTNFATNGRNAIAVSPDGTQIAYVANSRLYMHSLGDLEAREIPGTETRGVINSPVFSPDGRSLAYFDQADGALKRIAVSGGSAVTICQAGMPWGMSWDEPGIVFGRGREGILGVSPSGPKPEVVAAAKAGELASQPQLLPGGNAVMFSLTTGQWDKAQIIVQNLKSGTRTVLIEKGSAARYVPTGHIVYAVGATLLAVPFDLNRLQVSGTPVPVLEGVMRSLSIGTAQFSFSGTGTLAYRADSRPTSSSLVFVDAKGVVDPVKLPPGPYHYPRVSRDGKRLTYGTDDGKDAAVWIYDLSGSNAPQRLTFQGAARYPVWSPDSQRVAFQWDREGDAGIFWQRADAAGTAERLTQPEKGVAHIPDSFSPDGKYLSFTAVPPSGATFGLWILSMSDRKAALFAESPGSILGASVFSPDGKWIAYSTPDDGTGKHQVYVKPFPATAGKYQVARGAQPVWSRDGKQLLFTTDPGTFGMVNVTTEGGLRFSRPAALPSGGLIQSAIGPRTYDNLPDGRMVGIGSPVQSGATAGPQIRVVLNWFEDLKQRVPPK